MAEHSRDPRNELLTLFVKLNLKTLKNCVAVETRANYMHNLGPRSLTPRYLYRKGHIDASKDMTRVLTASVLVIIPNWKQSKYQH